MPGASQTFEMLDFRCFPRVHKTKPFSLSRFLEEEVERRGRPYFILLWLKKKKTLTLCNTGSTILASLKCTAQQHHVSSPRCVEFQNFSIRKPEAQGPFDENAPPPALDNHLLLSVSMILDKFGYFLRLESDGVCPL